MATSRDMCHDTISGHAIDVTSAGSGPGDISQLLRNIHFRTVFQGNSEVTVDKDRSQYVRTDSFRDAEEMLKTWGQVVLCGPPGCGKTTVAYALCRLCREEGFAVYVLERLEQWRSRVGEQERSVVVLDGIFGEVRVDSQQHACWKRILDNLLEALKAGSCKLIITVYPHVLRELQQLERNLKSPLRGVGFLVHMDQDHLSGEVKKKMLNFHLNKLNLDQDSQSQIVEDIVRSDVSGPVFPWCCGHLVHHWHSSDDPTAIFSVPAEVYAGLLKQMVLDDRHGHIFAAVLCLTMKGAYNFLHHRLELARHLQELGFDECSPDRLARYADILLGSVLKEGWFSSRVLYDATGIAVGRFFRFPTLMRICDARFLVQYVHTTVTKKTWHEGAPPEVPVTVGLESDDCSDRKRHADDYQVLLQRISTDIVQGNLQHICQHPSLQRRELLQDLYNYCCGNKLQLVKAVDCVHALPLLYWSVFHPSHVLTHWCLSKEQALQKLSVLVLVAFSFFDNITGSSTSRLPASLYSGFNAEHFHYPQCVMELPLLGKDDCLTKDIQKQMATITGGHPTYLPDVALPIPPDVVTVELTEDKVQLKVRDQSHWYLVYRLLSDRQSRQTDQDGLSLLDIAVSCGQWEAVALSLKAGAVITQQNGQGVAYYHMTHETRALAAQNRTQSDTDRLFRRLPEMNMIQVQLLLLQEISVKDKDSTGRTGLHVACGAGRGDIADLFIELGADVHGKNSWCGFTPLHWACRKGLVHTTELLIERRAKVSTSTEKGTTALHCACHCDSHTASADVTRLLLRAEVDINKKDKKGRTPLHLAAQNGHVDTVDLLVQHGADVNVQNNRYTPLLCAARNGHTATVDLLVQHGADVNVQDNKGCTPLLCAARNGHTATVDLLVQHGADVNVHNNKESTALMLAYINGHTATGDLLVQHGADVNVQNVGYTPLLCAAISGHTATVDFLLQHGADANVQDNEEFTPLIWAALFGDTAIADLLVQHMEPMSMCRIKTEAWHLSGLS